jgi:hypothetical protein
LTHRKTEKERQLADGRVGEVVWGRAKAHDGEKAWSSIIHSILSTPATVLTNCLFKFGLQTSEKLKDILAYAISSSLKDMQAGKCCKEPVEKV